MAMQVATEAPRQKDKRDDEYGKRMRLCGRYSARIVAYFRSFMLQTLAPIGLSQHYFNLLRHACVVYCLKLMLKLKLQLQLEWDMLPIALFRPIWISRDHKALVGSIPLFAYTDILV
ncbi:hypothetical protein V6N11_024215 [Hibiscus sabdariffa]|uniref:Uncharacterized protein n=1 Tax=Hibiscus sabdariffa TaxID=183260 RepID=A0ABR1ZMJ8_9ROSI